jgi:hypothetical protein
MTAPDDAARYYVHPAPSPASLPPHHFKSIRAALDHWKADSQKNGARAGIIELVASGVYPGPVRVNLAKGTTLVIRAANRTRPVIRLQDDDPDGSDAIDVRGDAGSQLILDGLLVTGRGLEVRGPTVAENAPQPSDLCGLTIRDCTFVPGWALRGNCDPWQTTEPSILLYQTGAMLSIVRSIVGPIHVFADEFRTDPLRIDIADSIVDATGPSHVAIGSAAGGPAFAILTVVRSTVIGRIAVHALDLGENAVFASPMTVARKQRGCIRYSYVAPDSRSPRRHRCQPDLAIAAIDPTLTQAERQTEVERVRLRVSPQFVAMRYGSPDYCRLVAACSDEIRRGADDASEMGVFHDLFEPQREDSLRARMDQSTPAGMQAGLVFVN